MMFERTAFDVPSHATVVVVVSVAPRPGGSRRRPTTRPRAAAMPVPRDDRDAARASRSSARASRSSARASDGSPRIVVPRAEASPPPPHTRRAASSGRRPVPRAALALVLALACALAPSDRAPVLASAAPAEEPADPAGDTVAVVFVTARDGANLTACRRGLVSSLVASSRRASEPESSSADADASSSSSFSSSSSSSALHSVFVLHGGNATGASPQFPPSSSGPPPGVRLIAQRDVARTLPARLRCDCGRGNGGTPFQFMQWLADSDHAFGWYVEEDVVFTGDWTRIFRLRVEEERDSSEERPLALGHPPEQQQHPSDEQRPPSFDFDSDSDSSSAPSPPFSGPADLVAHVTRVESAWKKRCVMPGRAGCANVDTGHMHKTWWPVLGISRNLAKRLMDAIAEPNGANGHQETITYAFCDRTAGPKPARSEEEAEAEEAEEDGTSAKSPEVRSKSVRTSGPEGDGASSRQSAGFFCRHRPLPASLLGAYHLGHWGRFMKPRDHATFTGVGLTWGANLRANALYHPLKCEADGGIGRLAALMAEARGDLDKAADEATGGRGIREAYFERWAASGNASSGTAVMVPKRRETAAEGAEGAEGGERARERAEERERRATKHGRPFARPVNGPKPKKKTPPAPAEEKAEAKAEAGNEPPPTPRSGRGGTRERGGPGDETERAGSAETR